MHNTGTEDLSAITTNHQWKSQHFRILYPTKTKVRASGSDSMPFEIRSGVRKGCALSPTLFNYIVDWILGLALQDYPGVLVGANIHVSYLAYADDIVILSSSYSEM